MRVADDTIYRISKCEWVKCTEVACHLEPPVCNVSHVIPDGLGNPLQLTILYSFKEAYSICLNKCTDPY